MDINIITKDLDSKISIAKRYSDQCLVTPALHSLISAGQVIARQDVKPMASEWGDSETTRYNKILGNAINDVINNIKIKCRGNIR